MVEAVRWAVIDVNGTVENVILWDGIETWSPCHEDDQVILIVNDDPTIGEPFVD